ncbi:putative D-aminoacylase [Bombardia bombarda]|uniref:D-aminoacylase n=1 Tax=Bombardia bombarda TaxID=252184 RepID=A0AA39TW09_9PEZI|nr:putative D-aminoacylase [Bombardia bombarda]
MLLSKRLQALGPLFADICRIAGTPGLSLGVLHYGDVVHQADIGYRDVDAHLPPNNGTVYHIASLTKAFTAAMVGILVDEGRLDWTTQLQHVVPEFERSDAAANITIADLLSHRTGLPGYDALWLLSDNKVRLKRRDAISILSYVPASAPLRTEWLYNNFAYEAVGQVIERLSGIDYASFLKDRILEPLGMSKTFYTDFPANSSDFAMPYIGLQNATPFQVPQPFYGRDVLLGSAGGIRSSVHDLLVFYKALIDAAQFEIEGTGMDSGRLNPLKHLEQMWRPLVGLPAPSLREVSYASGWLRAQLPTPLADYGPGTKPMLGAGLPSRLGLFHGGEAFGFTSFVALFPETSSAVVVLSNALALTDTTRLVGQLLIEELFGNKINETEYVEYAESSSEQTGSVMANIKKQLLRNKTVDTPAYPIKEYVGTYYNSIGNYFIEIRETSAGNLKVYFMGLDSDAFDLEPYQQNSFYWLATHDELAQRARYTTFPKEYYILKFDHPVSSEDLSGHVSSNINSLRWKHEFSLQGEGEVFWKRHRDDQNLLWLGQKPL